jgi:RNA polymerase primary sigma factor
MAKFRLDTIAELARQLSFTPHELRSTQLSAAEELLFEIDPAKAYPTDFIIYRVTGYRPKRVKSELLTGLALVQDLGLLIEQVSRTLQLREEASIQPVLTIEEVSRRFNVTTKTIQRWRRRGLPARMFIFPDNKWRVGFLLSTVERFFAIRRDQVAAAGNHSQISPDEQAYILRQSRRLAVDCRCPAGEIARRIGRRLNRSPAAISYCVKHHDQQHPDSAILPLAAQPISAAQCEEIFAAYRHGGDFGSLARQYNRPRSAIYRAIIERRFDRLLRRRVKFIDDPLYHESNAAEIIDDLIRQGELPRSAAADEQRVPRDLPAYLRDLYRTPLLTPARERALFLKLNFQKFQFVAARRQIDPETAGLRELKILESLRRRVQETKNQLVRANLRLVVSVARKHLRPGLYLMELISDGNMSLLRAVESFDIHRGNRFSTYATLALLKGFARSVPEMQQASRGLGESGEWRLASVADAGSQRDLGNLLDREQIRSMLSKLEPRERDVLSAHYGLSEIPPATYEQLGGRMGLSKQRIRQIEKIAIAKLRAIPQINFPHSAS